MNAIRAWFEKKGGVSHVIAGVYLSAVTLYGVVPAFANALNSVYRSLPEWAHQTILATLGIIAWYRNNQKGDSQ